MACTQPMRASLIGWTKPRISPMNDGLGFLLAGKESGLFTARVIFSKLRILWVKSEAQVHNPHLISPPPSSVNHIPRQPTVLHLTPASTRLLHDISRHVKDDEYIATWLVGQNTIPAAIHVVQIDNTRTILVISWNMM